MRRFRLEVAATVVVASALWAAQASASVYWGNFDGGAGTTIGRASLDGIGTLEQSFVTAASGPLGVTVDGQYVYWTNIGGTIGRANLDGSGTPNPSFITGASEPEGLAVNGQYIYWSNVGTGTIARANLDGSAPNETFITGASAPTGVVVNDQFIYWSNFSSGAIGRANLDGTAVNQNFITGAGNAGGVAVNENSLYWSNSSTNTIARANLDGSGKPDLGLVAGANAPREMAVDGQYIYWANIGGTTIGRARLDGTEPNQSFITTAGNAFGVAVDAGPVGVATPSVPSLTFASQPLDTYSAPQALTITNSGHGILHVANAQVSSGDTDDFLITTDTCSHAVLWPGGTCAIDVRFGPVASSAPNGRAATLTLTSDDPSGPVSIVLEGTGGQLPQGPVGPQGSAGPEGSAGPQGSAGAQGPSGKDGQVELVTCKAVTVTVPKRVHGKRKKAKTPKQQCTTTTVSGPVNFTTATTARAALSRAGVVYATGAAIRKGERPAMLLRLLRTLAPGRYTLSFTWTDSHGRSRFTHQRVSVG